MPTSQNDCNIGCDYENREKNVGMWAWKGGGICSKLRNEQSNLN